LIMELMPMRMCLPAVILLAVRAELAPAGRTLVVDPDPNAGRFTTVTGHDANSAVRDLSVRYDRKRGEVLLQHSDPEAVMTGMGEDWQGPPGIDITWRRSSRPRP